MNGMILSVQRYCLHDGPGIRTTVFFKGCNLRCFWCHNPESWEPRPRLRVRPDLCAGCGACVRACPDGCHSIQGGKKLFARERCRACGACAAACPSGALELAGYAIAPDALLAEILRDKPFYDNTGGGVTFSGGECMLQIDFLEETLRRCKRAGLHTAVDTAGDVPFGSFGRILPFTDLFLYDVKCAAGSLHRRGTGRDNRRIKENLARLLEVPGCAVRVRIPVIPGFNMTQREMGRIARFLRGLPRTPAVELLPRHALGADKRASLGLPEEPGAAPPSEEDMRRCSGILGTIEPAGF